MKLSTLSVLLIPSLFIATSVQANSSEGPKLIYSAHIDKTCGVQVDSEATGTLGFGNQVPEDGATFKVISNHNENHMNPKLQVTHFEADDDKITAQNTTLEIDGTAHKVEDLQNAPVEVQVGENTAHGYTSVGEFEFEENGDKTATVTYTITCTHDIVKVQG
ncbi:MULTISPECIES: hypothetical protein [Vibrio]|uniref:Uncharacterized protein n=1 Tax=Vibrio mediterranei TaxID=689 RepID=A0ABX5D4I8_9VIBR|nr:MULTISPECIES: hypothetical protein [Vibrio]KFA95720.1 hypothetical protein HW45_25535 [Vibrio sp. ER1A]NUW72433.1 hypothetical protein [Vibrio mediterranei]PCD86408.1 hypothetical protein COR52_21210 [Vibrio mediterranei]PRQ64574.1 hypothetical protein COR51_26810 [Vibrio mediterranei]SBO11613.1 hypothetical protein VME0621_03749 [Vibrio mediterranei]